MSSSLDRIQKNWQEQWENYKTVFLFEEDIIKEVIFNMRITEFCANFSKIVVKGILNSDKVIIERKTHTYIRELTLWQIRIEFSNKAVQTSSFRKNSPLYRCLEEVVKNTKLIA